MLHLIKNNPITGIKTISVTQVNAQNVEIKIVGDGKLPKVEEINDTQELIFSIVADTKAASTPQAAQDTPIELTSKKHIPSQ